MKMGDEMPARYDLSKLRLLGSVGEPINPEAWMWYHRVIGKRALPHRRHLVADRDRRDHDLARSRATPTKPGSCTRPLPGIFVAIVDDAAGR